MGGCASKPKVLKAEKAPPPAAEKLEAENVEVENVKVEVEAEDKSAAKELKAENVKVEAEAENVKVEVEAEDKSAAEELEAVAVAEAEDKSAAEEVKVEVKAEDEAEAAPQIKTDGVETKNDKPQVDLSEPAAVAPVLDEIKEADKEEVVPAESKPTETMDKELTEEKKEVV